MGLLGLKSRIFVVILLFLIPFRLFGIGKFGKLCNQEVLKEKINKELVEEYCSKASKNYIEKKGFGNASWFYLLSGDIDKNINEIQPKIDDGFLVNIGHSYLFKNDFNKSKMMYEEFLKNFSIFSLNKKLQNNFEILLKLYPKDKDKILKGLEIWNKIYMPLSPINHLNKNYRKAKKAHEYKKAIKYLLKIISLEEKYHKNNSDIATNYNNIGEIYKSMGKYDKALSFYQKDLNLTEQIEGKYSPSTAISYNSMGKIYKAMNQYSKSLKYYEESLTINKKLFGINHPFTAIIYNEIAGVYKNMGDYTQSLKYYQEALDIKKNVSSKNNLSISTSYNNISLVYNSMGKYPKALISIQKSLDISTEILAKNHPYIATIYNNKGLIYQSMGQYDTALAFFKKSLKIKEKRLKSNHLSILKSYNNIGAVYEVMGNYPNALIFYKKVLNKKGLQDNANIIGTSYNNVAQLYGNMGEYSKALKYYQKALKTGGNSSIFRATIYNNISSVYSNLGKYQKALNYNQDALNLLGNNHPFRADIYNNIGLLYNDTNNYSKALEYYKKALNIKEKILAKNHPSLATIYNNMGLSYQNKNKYHKSLKYFQQALDIRKEVLTKNHPSMIISYNSISGVYFSMKKYSKAYNNSVNSFKVFIQNRNKNFTILDSKEKEKYLKGNDYILHYLLASSNKYLKQLKGDKKQIKSEILKREILNNWINYKGVLFEYQNILTIVEEKTKDSSLKQKIKEYRNFIKYLAHLKKQQVLDINPKKYKEEITRIQNKISKLEISLGNNKTSIKIQELFGLKDIKFTAILSKLGVNQLYIDFAKTDKNYYIFTLNKNNEINFIQIDEKDTKNLDENIKKLKLNNKKMVQAIKDKNIKQKKKKLKQESQVIFSKLYTTLISKYLAKELKDKNSLIISPDGLLNFLPFEALYHNGKYFIEEYQISYISSGREFVRETKREKAKPKYEMICFGNPDFNTTLPISDIRKLGKQNPDKKLDTWEQYTSFNPLGNAEIEMIRALYKNNTLIYEGKRATVKNLMSVESPKILHLSTHGKFLNNTNILNPMLRAGLAFTGANKSLEGIVTALKLSALDLKDTELVVLSACESGIGKVQNAEGVVGLPKAFLQAGARNVVMSLWSVSNLKTTELMKYFYENINQGQTYATALRNAKIEMIEMHPYYWSAFIIHGIQN